MAKRLCGYCGKEPDGHAKVNDVWLCHPDDLDKPDCYSLYQSRVLGEVVMRNDAHGNLVFWAEPGTVSGTL